MAKTNNVARHHELNKIAAILQEMGTQYVEQFLPGRESRAVATTQPQGWFIYPSPHVYINKRETGFSGCVNQLSGILTTFGVQFRGAYKGPTRILLLQ